MNGSKDASAMFDPAAHGGKARSDELPPSWPGNDPDVGAGVAGRVAGYDSFTSTKDKNAGERVPVLRLEHAVTFTPAKGDTPSALAKAGDVGIIIGAGLRRRVGDAVLPKGSYVSIRYTGVDATLNNMRTYEVYDVDRMYLARLHEAAGMGQSRPTGKAEAMPAPSKTDHDDLPF